MRFTAKSKSSSEGWGMGFYLIFFPDDDEREGIDHHISTSKRKLPNLFSSSSSGGHLILSKAQSTIFICALLVFLSLLLFTLSTFEPSPSRRFSPRRHLSSTAPFPFKPSNQTPSHALQGMGALHRRGTAAMNDLVLAHLSESVSPQEFRLFLRLFHRSPLAATSDLLLLFPSQSHSSDFEAVIREENLSFFKLIGSNSTANFGLSRKKGKEWAEPIWGRRIKTNYSEGREAESIRVSYGSVVSFLVGELDPENSLSGFLDHVPMSLRRWACYPMLLGRVRKNFKHVMLVDVKEVLLLGDPLGRVRARSPETVVVVSSAPPAKHAKRNPARTQPRAGDNPASSAVVMGGARGVRRLSSAMLVEIVRAATQQRRKNSVTESTLFSQLVGNEFVLRNVNVVKSGESLADASSLTWWSSDPASSLSLSKPAVARRGNSNNITSTIATLICKLELDSSVYSDCQRKGKNT
ncbi:uncharacterized protein LOC127789358 [Diospyros lotus]|uniref:uncharacterized protein LOC127789358 n=1 Tax=Diospyros lotus TaxID=55363 RepID=UPI002250EF4D|nr:uncharacterized protein LOC127789358 [Diospyros lotus]